MVSKQVIYIMGLDENELKLVNLIIMDVALLVRKHTQGFMDIVLLPFSFLG